MVSYRFHVVTCLVMDEISPTARTLDLVNNNIEIDLEKTNLFLSPNFLDESLRRPGSLVMVTQLPPAACTSVKCSSSLIWLAGPSCSCHSCPSCHWPCLGSYKLIFTLGTVRSFLNISSIIKSDLTCWISTIVISNIQNFHCPVIVVCNYLSTILNNLSIKSIQSICLSHHEIDML